VTFKIGHRCFPEGSSRSTILYHQRRGPRRHLPSQRTIMPPCAAEVLQPNDTVVVVRVPVARPRISASTSTTFPTTPGEGASCCADAAGQRTRIASTRRWRIGIPIFSCATPTIDSDGQIILPSGKGSAVAVGGEDSHSNSLLVQRSLYRIIYTRHGAIASLRRLFNSKIGNFAH
jgi:hypothetical protein